MTTPITVSKYGVMSDGTAVDAWTLRGSGGLTVEILTYGCIVRRILAPDSNGKTSDVVLGYNTLEGYLKDPFFILNYALEKSATV